MDEGVCTNQAESYFSRLRRMEIGMHHHTAGPYLNAYAGQAAWREDNRRRPNGDQAALVAGAAMAAPQSRTWAGIGSGRREWYRDTVQVDHSAVWASLRAIKDIDLAEAVRSFADTDQVFFQIDREATSRTGNGSLIYKLSDAFERHAAAMRAG